MRIKSKLLLVFPLFLLFALAACDNDSDSSAQVVGGTESVCPCYTADDITDDAVNKAYDGCSFVPTELNLAITLFEGSDPFLILVQCEDADFGSDKCFCTDLVRGVEMLDITKEQYFDCAQILTDAITKEFGQASMDLCLISNVN